MNNLLHANFARLWKNKLFWSGSFFMLLYGIFKVVSESRTAANLNEELILDDLLFTYAFVTGIVSAVFISFFTGTEYSDGTIRNKLIVGHSRSKLYFSNLVTNIFAVVFMCFAYFIVVLIIGTVVVGSLNMGIGEAVQIFCGSLLLITAYCSVYTLLAMLCNNKAATAAIGTAASFLFLFGEAYIGSMLALPGYYVGAKRRVLEFLFDYLPSGQAYQYMSMEFANFGSKILCLAIISAAAAMIGTIMFQRKDIK